MTQIIARGQPEDVMRLVPVLVGFAVRRIFKSGHAVGTNLDSEAVRGLGASMPRPSQMISQSHERRATKHETCLNLTQVSDELDLLIHSALVFGTLTFTNHLGSRATCRKGISARSRKKLVYICTRWLPGTSSSIRYKLNPSRRLPVALAVLHWDRMFPRSLPWLVFAPAGLDAFWFPPGDTELFVLVHGRITRLDSTTASAPCLGF
jgi:hypothetical protein